MIDRSQDILYQLIVEKNINEKNLLRELSITQRQLEYSIFQINERLEELDIPQIEKKKGNYLFSKKIAELFHINSSIKDVVFHSEERIQIILLKILSRDDYISLDHFSLEMNVSKNTILSDMKICKRYILEYNIKLNYSRNTGYTIIGSEWDKRIIIFNAISILQRRYDNEVLEELLGDFQEEIASVEKYLSRIEEFLSKKYTDEDFNFLIYFISFILKRISNGKLIDNYDLFDKEEIKKTKEYQASIYLSGNLPELPEYERYYLSLQLLSSRVRKSSVSNEEYLTGLANALWEFLIEFETNALIAIDDKKKLHKDLIDHFKPIYYQIKYNLPAENVLYDQIITKYKVLHGFVRKSIKPLDDFFKTKIQDTEIAYITLFIGGHILGKESINDNMVEKVVKAVVLCPNGTSMSKLIERELQELFPEFLFYPSISIREYQGFILPHSIVFSTIPVQSDKEVYLISGLLNSEKKFQLRQEVINNLFKLNFDSVDSADILKVIKKYADVKDEKRLIEDLNFLLIQNKTFEEDNKQQNFPVHLLDILDESVVQIINEDITWEKALNLAAQMLIKKEVISEKYRLILQDEYKEMPEYILLKQQALLPHLDPDKVKQKLGVSMLVLRKGLAYQGTKVYLVILLTTPNKSDHLDVLFDINQITNNEILMLDIINSKTEKEILTKLRTITLDLPKEIG